MGPSIKKIKIALEKILVILNAYFQATMSKEEKEKYLAAIKESGIINLSVESPNHSHEL